MKKLLINLCGYLLIFLVIYSAVNFWRAPAMPQVPQLTYLQHQTPIDVIAQSHKEPVLLYFWGTWCSICRFTTPNIQQLHQTGTPIVSVAVKSDSTDELSTYLQTHDYDFIVINDLAGDIFADWQGKVVPTFIILKDGEIKQSFTGFAPLWSLKARLWFARL
ncbi:protein disulfide oxidoreductase [Moraxella sp. ZY200743]|uniref:protein disulfide oxidoreductase n=1 Tax=Moraxella sp. ZY200743 TaxID=2911970 RepID=UPI003D7E1D98